MEKMKYRVIAAHNPKTGKTLYRPVIVQQYAHGLDSLVYYAKENGYVRGQQEELKGTFLGFMQCLSELLNEGYDITIDGFMGFKHQLRGTINGRDGKLTEKNSLTVAITPYSRLRVELDPLAWKRVDD